MDVTSFLDWLIVVVLGINTLLSVGVLLRNPKSLANRLFVGFVTFLDIWIASNFLENEPGLVGEGRLEFFLRLDFATALIFFYFWFQFSAVLSVSRIAKIRWLQYLLIGLTVLGVVLSFTPLILHSVSFDGEVIAFEDGVLWLGYALLLLLFAGWGVILLILRRRRAKRVNDVLAKRQISLVLTGFVLAMVNGLFINLVLQTFFGVSLEVSRLGLYGMTLLVAFTAYAVARQQLFDFRPILARAVGFLAVIVLVAVAFAFVLFTGVATLLGIEITVIRYAVGLGLLVAAMLAFQPLQQLVRRLTNRVFFRGLYDSERLLSDFTHIMAGTIDLAAMTNELLQHLTGQMNVSKAAFVLFEGHEISGVQQVGYDQTALENSKLEKFLHWQSNRRKPILYDEITDVKSKERFRELDVTVAIPILVEQREVALLLLGPKLSGEIYYQRDLNVLDIFAREAGVAIHNAKLYAAQKRFNEELEDMVEDRTRQLRETQRRELEKAQAVTKLKDEFVFIAAHELRTPVTAIRGFLELVEMAETKLDPEVSNHLEKIEMASKHLNQLVNDLLEIARSDAGTMDVETSPVDVGKIAKELIGEVSSLARERSIAIRLDAAAGQTVALADGDKVREVIMNLVSNAIKYNREGGTITVKVAADGDMIQTKVVDTGYGIPGDQQKKIFQKFFRVGTKRTQGITGTGLGLFISRMLVEKMKGKISFTSVEDQGSTFMFSLPRA